MTKRLPRSIRNANPLNIDHNPANRWVGILPVAQRSPVQQDEQRFEVFKSQVYGFRAATILLQNYQENYGLKTVRQIVNRWAPPVENNTSAYASVVARKMGVGIDEEIDVQDYDIIRPMIEAMAQHETGLDHRTGALWQFDPAVIDEGLRRAGITPNIKPRIPVETVGPVAVGTLGVADLSDALPQILVALEQSEGHISSGNMVRLAFGLFTVGIAVWFGYSQIKTARLKAQ